MTNTFPSLDKQIAEIEANLRLIEERKAQYVLPTDIPLQLIRNDMDIDWLIDREKVRVIRPGE